MDLNPKALFNEALTEFLPEFKKKAKDFFAKFFNNKIHMYFVDSHELQELKNNPSLARYRGYDIKDPDVGLAERMINDFITDHILDDSFKHYMRQYMDQNFGKHLNEAMDKAMKHKAHAIAFKEIRKVGGPHRAMVVLHEVLKFLEDQGQAVTRYGSVASTDYTELVLPYKLGSVMIDRFAIAFPKCVVNEGEDGQTYLRVYYDEHINQQAK